MVMSAMHTASAPERPTAMVLMNLWNASSQRTRLVTAFSVSSMQTGWWHESVNVLCYCISTAVSATSRIAQHAARAYWGLPHRVRLTAQHCWPYAKPTVRCFFPQATNGWRTFRNCRSKQTRLQLVWFSSLSEGSCSEEVWFIVSCSADRCVSNTTLPGLTPNDTARYVPGTSVWRECLTVLVPAGSYDPLQLRQSCRGEHHINSTIWELC